MIQLENWVQSPLAAAAGWALFHSLWEGALIAIVLAAALGITRSARSRYISACLAMCAILACFGVTLLHLAPLEHLRGSVRNPIVFGRDNLVSLADHTQAPVRGIADVLPWLVPFWMAGVILFYLRHLAGWAWTRRLRRTGLCAAPLRWHERLKQLATRLRLSKPVGLFESCLTEVPIVMGHLRPVILMPLGLLAGMPAGQIESILLHELAHIRRRDYLVNMLQTTVEGLLFYHPVVWWISGVIRAERECCCDDLAVTLGASAHEYAVALAALEENRLDVPETVLAATGGNLVKRVRRLLYPAQGPGSALTPFVSAAILLITASIGLIAWQSNASVPTTPAQQISPFTKWLEEDVVYIITDEERNAFAQLNTDDEREAFVEQFWLRRDPTPGTEKNEFNEEHYRRIAFANLHFPTAQGTAGWRTDRGRIYIRFGPPDEIDAHRSGTQTRPDPFEDWRYRYIQGIGSDVMIEFIDPTHTSDYRMTTDPSEIKALERR